MKNGGQSQLKGWLKNSVVRPSLKLENEPRKLVESLEHKQQTSDWIDSLIVKESNAAYG
jgi:hypothetical protein